MTEKLHIANYRVGCEIVRPESTFKIEIKPLTWRDHLRHAWWDARRLMGYMAVYMGIYTAIYIAAWLAGRGFMAGAS